MELMDYYNMELTMQQLLIKNKWRTMEEDFIESLPQDQSSDKDEEKTGLWYAIYILQNAGYKLIASGGQIYIYYKGEYLSLGSRAKTLYFVNRCLLKIDDILFAGAKITQKVLEEFYMQYQELTPYYDDNCTYINMKSNVLAIYNDGTIETVPHDQKYNFTYKLNYDHDPDAQCPVFDKFINSSLNDPELVDVIGEYFGYILNNNSKNHEKALFLYGDGSNGKSTLINIIKALLGNENISVVELTEMGDMLKCALMDGKILNISSDAKKNGLDTSAFKKIVSREPILGKYLFKDIYTIVNIPKLLVAMNKLPYSSGDNSHGFYRRLLLVPFTTVIKEEDKDYGLEAKVISNELPALLNFAITGMQRLTKQGKFTEAKAMKEAMNSYKESANHVATFLEEEQYVAVEATTKTGTKAVTIYKEFATWCKDRGHNPYSSHYLNNELDHLGYVAYKNSSKHYRMIRKNNNVENRPLHSGNPY